VTNYILHKHKPLTALSVVGLSLIFGSNSEWAGQFLPASLHDSRAYNTLGCAMLIGSSYLQHKVAPHDHDHGHSHKPACPIHKKPEAPPETKEHKH
jgi:hypothetical protein